MKKLSDSELIDLVALNRILDGADQVFWGIEDGYHYLSDAHMAVKVRISNRNLTALKVLAKRFHGDTPIEGLALRSVRRRKNQYDMDVALDAVKRCLNEKAESLAVDTRIMYETEYGGVVRAMYVEDLSHTTYVFLNMAFLECINANNVAHAVKAAHTSPIHFRRGDEVAVVMPINMHTPAFMEKLN